jgi:hypothetical protein
MYQKDAHGSKPVNSMRFDVVLRQDDDGYYVATVPELPGCHSQAKSLDELMSRNQGGHFALAGRGGEL